MSELLARAWVQQVARCESTDLPPYIRQGIHSCASEAGPLLFELVEAPSVWDSLAAYHIVALLGELRYEPATHFLVDLLWDEPELTEAHEALVKIGEPAIPYLLMNVYRFPEEMLPTLVEIARGAGRADVRGAFEALLKDHVPAASEHAGRLADPALVPALLACLEEADATDPTNRHRIVQLCDAVTQLGGELGELADKVTTVRQANARRLAALAAGTYHKHGRRRK